MAISPYGVNLDSPPSNNINTIEIYRNNTLAEIRADLDTRRNPVINVCMNLTKDLNKASAIRANNAFSGEAIYLVGRRQYDRRGAVGTHLYEHVFHADTLEDVVNKYKPEGYTFFAVDNNVEIEGFTPENIWDVEIPRKSVFVYGEEQRGLSEEEIKLCDRMVYVQQTGSVRSLNIAQACSVIMGEYSRHYRL